MSVTTIAPPPHAAAQRQPAAEAPSGPIFELARRSFKVMNRWFMVPLLRAGLGAWLGTPVGGWILLLRVRGRHSGAVRDNPLSYLVRDGSVWVMAGFGDRTDWYRNVLADPRVGVILAGREMSCTAEVIDDPDVRRDIIPRLARAAGLPGYMTGVDPFRADPNDVLAATTWVPLIRLRPDNGPISAGPDDPGGLGWVWRQATVLVVGAWVIGRLRRLLNS